MDHEFAWRLKEIADLKLSVLTAKDPKQRALIRAGVPVLYAHWEGFVRSAARGYLDFVYRQGYNFEDLDSCFVALGARKHLSALTESRKASLAIEAVDFVRTCGRQRATANPAKAVDTKANLSSRVFEEIAISVGLLPARYTSRYNLIDTSLLKRRNRIAHGEFLDLAMKEYSNLSDETLVLLRWFKTDLENAAATKAYLKPDSQAAYSVSLHRSGGAQVVQ